MSTNASSSTPTQWSIEADYLQACNCDYGCPCEFEAPPTLGFCEGAGVWKIIRGNFGQVTLDGLAFGFAIHFPEAMHKGHGTAAFFFDERANAAQREALFQIASGQAGGMPFEILVTLFTHLLPPYYVPIDFQLDGKNSRARVGDLIRLGMEPIKNPVTKTPEDIRVEHGTGFIFKSAEVVSALECESRVPDLKFNWPNKAGFVSRVHYCN
ncbi:MAG: DUF1326 domain-containing protein [Verrucomicrobiota bacterium]|jgi:hypothetical protein